MADSWKCPKCPEYIEAPGPVSLQLCIDAHNREVHPTDIPPMPVKWHCDFPGCQEVIERSNETNLQAAIAGHKIYRHTPKKDGQPLGYGGLAPDHSTNEPTEEEIKWLADLKVKW